MPTAMGVETNSSNGEENKCNGDGDRGVTCGLSEK